jgi:hypothetical protein
MGNAIAATAPLRVGDWVEVRTAPEILHTLDGAARSGGLPFMPQMLAYCGQRFRVAKRVHKFCDTAHSTGARQMEHTVLLHAPRCDGAAFGGCEMRCAILWKEAWLKPVSGPDGPPLDQPTPAPSSPPRCSEADVWAATRADHPGHEEPVYRCQATQLPAASRPLSGRSIRQYIQDCTSGNARWPQVVQSLLFRVYSGAADAGLGFGAALRWLYDVVQRVRGGWPYPCRPGRIPPGSRTPSARLGLQRGEVVRVKSYADILATVDEGLRNRGMSFHPEMVPYCGKTFSVLMRVGKIIDERTGRLQVLKNECIVLAGAECLGRYTKPLGCPRACYPYWREAWLERVVAPVAHGLHPDAPAPARRHGGEG